MYIVDSSIRGCPIFMIKMVRLFNTSIAKMCTHAIKLSLVLKYG